MRDLASSMAEWLRARVHEAGARGIVLGLSGGIDSAVVARVSQMALPGGVMTVIMPANSDPQDAADAQLVAETFDLPVLTIDLARPLEALFVQTQQDHFNDPQVPYGPGGDDAVGGHRGAPALHRHFEPEPAGRHAGGRLQDRQSERRGDEHPGHRDHGHGQRDER